MFAMLKKLGGTANNNNNNKNNNDDDDDDNNNDNEEETTEKQTRDVTKTKANAVTEKEIWDKYRGPAPIPESDLKPDWHDGMLMLMDEEPAHVHAPKVKAMEMFPDDVLLCTYPRSGTHWTFRILDMLIRGSAQYSPVVMTCRLVDVQPVEGLGRAERPRLLNTHYPLDLLPRRVTTTRGLRVVHVYRNPKAVLASLAKFSVIEQHLGTDMKMDDAANIYLAEGSLYKNNFYYWDKVNEFERKNPHVKIFHMPYEELNRDTVGGIRRLAQFLGKEADDQFYKDVAQAVSFQNQRKTEMESNKISMGWRKGETDDWKNHLSVAHGERFDQILRERSPYCPFSRYYSLSERRRASSQL